MNIVYRSSPQAQWLELIQQAQHSAGYHFSDEITHYLLITLENYMTQLKLASSILAMEYLDAHNHSLQVKNIKLRNVGDECLLITGLFPGFINKKNLSPHYLISLGKNAYNHIANQPSKSQTNPQLYHVLSAYFIELTNILQLLRPISLCPVE